jgi:threonyl-tRNA synthetase
MSIRHDVSIRSRDSADRDKPVDPADHPPSVRTVDHRRVGRDLGIFASDKLAGSGFPLWLPDGAAIVSELEQYILDVERGLGYRHVRTPPVGKRELYEISGHWQHFGPDMFPPIPLSRAGDLSDQQADDEAAASSESEEVVLRPVMCPHHFLVYRSRLRSYRELPLRIGELGPQFRMERSGVVSGLTRVRGMLLNDAHVFCPVEQAAAEVDLALRMIDEAYDLLGIEPAYYRLSLRGPHKNGLSYAGSDEMWQRAEAILREAFALHGIADFQATEGEAAFYGPKIDVQVYDAQGREFTLSTVQVDLYQPEQFDLSYMAPDGSRRRPAVVHRSVISTMERMVAYLLEASGGALPPWLAPVQVAVLPVSPGEHEYAREVDRLCAGAGLRVEVDDRDESLGARIRVAQLRKVPFIAVVGSREVQDGSVAVRLRDGRQAGTLPCDRFVAGVRKAVQRRQRDLVLRL